MNLWRRTAHSLRNFLFVRINFEVRYDKSFNRVRWLCYSGVGIEIIRSLSLQVDEGEKGKDNEEEYDDDEVISEDKEDGDVVID